MSAVALQFGMPGPHVKQVVCGTAIRLAAVMPQTSSAARNEIDDLAAAKAHRPLAALLLVTKVRRRTAERGLPLLDL